MAQKHLDDLVVMVRDRHGKIIMIEIWCARKRLFESWKMRARAKNDLKAPTLNGTLLTFFKEAKYLGVIIKQNLTLQKLHMSTN